MADQKTKNLETEIKKAFKEKRFAQAKELINQVRQLDPKNKLAEKITKNIEEQEATQLKKERVAHLKKLEIELKDIIRAKSFDKIPGIIAEIRKIDPANKLAIKAEKIELSARIQKKSEELKNVMKAKSWELAKSKANELLALQWGQKNAVKALKAIAQEEKKNWEELITIEKPIEKPGFFSRWFGKKEEKKATPKPEMDKPKGMNSITLSSQAPSQGNANQPEVAQAKATAQITPNQVKTQPLTPSTEAKPTAVAAPESIPDQPAPTISAAQKKSTGNTFTNLFGKKKGAVEKEAGKSIIDAIVAKKETQKKIEQAPAKKKDETGEKFLKYSLSTLRFSMAFVLITAGFFYIYNIDENNQVLGLVGQENYASQLKAVANELEAKKQEEININKDIQRYQQGYQNTNRDRIDKIVENRLDWADLIRKLNEVTESVYEKNSLAQYVQYNNYSYEVESGRLTLSGTLSDPLGKNLTKLAELEEAFKYYPKDKNDPNSDIEPYFYDLQEFQSYSKSFNKETGRFTSNFSLSLSTKKVMENSN